MEAGGRCLFDVPYLPSLCGQCGPRDPGARPGTPLELWTSSRLAVLSTGVFDR
jgi:hypothetical protein